GGEGMPLTSVNIVAVFVAAILTFVLGAVWYSPVLFARQWMAAQGYTPDTAQQMRKGMWKAYVIAFVCYVVMAYVLALFASYMQATSFAQGLWLGFLTWLGFAATVGLTTHLFSRKPLAGWVIDAGYQLA